MKKIKVQGNFIKTRITTFIKTKFKISDDWTNIDKFILAANITEYHIISKLILQVIIITKLIMIRLFFKCIVNHFYW